MTDLENWLTQAVSGLSRESAAQIRAEIQEHYESARAAGNGDQAALAALGDAKAANFDYRCVMLTCSEARLLREGNWEARFFCSHKWLSWILIEMSVVALLASVSLFATGWFTMARIALAMGVGAGFLLIAPRLPIYTPERSRVLRLVKWVVQVATLLLAFGPGALRMWWLLVLCLWQFVTIESKRAAIRRKLPVEQWPRQLYL